MQIYGKDINLELVYHDIAMHCAIAKHDRKFDDEQKAKMPLSSEAESILEDYLNVYGRLASKEDEEVRCLLERD